jgi:hypothetical protein
MVRVKKFFRNGEPAWEVNVGAVVVAIAGIVVLALLTDNVEAMNTIASMFR